MHCFGSHLSSLVVVAGRHVSGIFFEEAGSAVSQPPQNKIATLSSLSSLVVTNATCHHLSSLSPLAITVVTCLHCRHLSSLVVICRHWSSLSSLVVTVATCPHLSSLVVSFSHWSSLLGCDAFFTFPLQRRVAFASTLIYDPSHNLHDPCSTQEASVKSLHCFGRHLSSLSSLVVTLQV